MVSLLALASVTLSPYALRGIATLPGMDWVELSNVGQTYGATSALLSAIALVGVVFSVTLQAGESLATRRQAARTFHHELMRMAMDDSAYADCLGLLPGPRTDQERRQYLYINLMIAFWEMEWDLGDLSEAEVRRNVSGQLFRSEMARQFWMDWGKEWIAIAETTVRRKRLRFAQILDDEYRSLLGAGLPNRVDSASGSGAARTPRWTHRAALAAGAGFFLGAATGAAIGAHRRS